MNIHLLNNAFITVIHDQSPSINGCAAFLFAILILAVAHKDGVGPEIEQCISITVHTSSHHKLLIVVQEDV